MEYREDIIRDGYLKAGEEFLAEQLGSIFGYLESPESVTAHNLMVNHIRIIVGEYNFGLFRKLLARKLLSNISFKQRKSIAEIILQLGRLLRYGKERQKETRKTVDIIR